MADHLFILIRWSLAMPFFRPAFTGNPTFFNAGHDIIFQASPTATPGRSGLVLLSSRNHILLCLDLHTLPLAMLHILTAVQLLNAIAEHASRLST